MAADAEALAGRLQVRSRTDREYQRVNSNRLFSTIDGTHGLRTTEPNAFLVETVRTLRPGKALDIGIGEGRNSIFLAQQGWEVTGVDLSDVGIAKANEHARRIGVRVNAKVQDISRFELGAGQWDLVCLLYFVIDESMNNLHQRIHASLKPGGLVIVEGVGLKPGVRVAGLEALIEEWHKWEPMKLQPLILDYREGKPSDWGGNSIGHMLLRKKPQHKLWGGLVNPPYFPVNRGARFSRK